MKVKVLRQFYDRSYRKWRAVDAVFDTTEEHFNWVNGAGYGQLVAQVDDAPKDTEAKPKAKPKEQAPAKGKATPKTNKSEV